MRDLIPWKSAVHLRSLVSYFSVTKPCNLEFWNDNNFVLSQGSGCLECSAALDRTLAILKYSGVESVGCWLVKSGLTWDGSALIIVVCHSTAVHVIIKVSEQSSKRVATWKASSGLVSECHVMTALHSIGQIKWQGQLSIKG